MSNIEKKTPAMGDPLERGSNEYCSLLRELVAAADEHGDEALTREPCFTMYARMMSIAPQRVYDKLQEKLPGSTAEYRQWSAQHLERVDHTEFFALLKQVGEIRRADGEGALHTDKYTGLSIRMMTIAPPRYRAEVDAIAAESGLIPTPTHVNADGEPVFALHQLADHIGADVDALQALAEEHLAPSAFYRGSIHAIH